MADGGVGSPKTTPVAVAGITGMTDVTCGRASVFAIISPNGNAYCWGYNSYGQLGDGTTNSPRMTPGILVGMNFFWPTSQPSSQPSRLPSRQSSAQPSRQPSSQPSVQPMTSSQQPTTQPSTHPSSHPSDQPPKQPSRQPSAQPSAQPTQQPQSLLCNHLYNLQKYQRLIQVNNRHRNHPFDRAVP